MVLQTGVINQKINNGFKKNKRWRNKERLSSKEKSNIIKSKKSAGSQGKYRRSSKTFVKGSRKKGATLRDWFQKENWINVATGKKCGE